MERKLYGVSLIFVQNRIHISGLKKIHSVIQVDIVLCWRFSTMFCPRNLITMDIDPILYNYVLGCVYVLLLPLQTLMSVDLAISSAVPKQCASIHLEATIADACQAILVVARFALVSDDRACILLQQV